MSRWAEPFLSQSQVRYLTLFRYSSGSCRERLRVAQSGSSGFSCPKMEIYMSLAFSPDLSPTSHHLHLHWGCSFKWCVCHWHSALFLSYRHSSLLPRIVRTSSTITPMLIKLPNPCLTDWQVLRWRPDQQRLFPDSLWVWLSGNPILLWWWSPGWRVSLVNWIICTAWVFSWFGFGFNWKWWVNLYTSFSCWFQPFHLGKWTGTRDLTCLEPVGMLLFFLFLIY